MLDLVLNILTKNHAGFYITVCFKVYQSHLGNAYKMRVPQPHFQKIYLAGLGGGPGICIFNQHQVLLQVV